jgi:HK97 family phage prohead protease
MKDLNKHIQEKLSKSYGAKNISFELKDISENSREVVFYASSFNVLDSDNDVIRKGAFTKSIQERGAASDGRKIAHLRNHDFEHQIGNIKEIYEDDFGLKVVSKLGQSTKANDALLDYQDGILREHSIGFNYVQDKIKFVEESALNEAGHWDITEVKLWEVSAVTFGANEFTPVLDVAKGLDNKSQLIKKLEQLNASFLKAIKNGKGTDERLENLEARFKQICELQKALATEKPLIKSTLKEQSRVSDSDKTIQSNNLFLNF